MNQNLFKAIIACGIVCFIACTTTKKAETEKWSERMARSEMKRFPEPWMIEKAKKTTMGIYAWPCGKINARSMETYGRQYILRVCQDLCG